MMENEIVPVHLSTSECERGKKSLAKAFSCQRLHFSERSLLSDAQFDENEKQTKESEGYTECVTLVAERHRQRRIEGEKL